MTRELPTMLKQLLIAGSLCLATVFTSSLAHADGTGLFIAGGVNYAQLDTSIDDDIDFDDDLEALFDDKTVGYNFGAGYRFTKWLAVDAAYWDLGEFKSDKLPSGDKIGFDTSIWTVGGIVSVPLWILDIYGRGGAAMWEVDSRYIDEDGTDLYYGVGAALNVFGSIDLYLEYVRFDADEAIDTAGLGVRWTF
ncbi:outer membrane beta-barrel protein [Seongchinamella sediminis]|nr:outer membrane beta-barrel protein [Seongchinamella sediminis]